MLPTMIIPRPRKEVNPFRGAFYCVFLRAIFPLPGGSARQDPRRRRRAGGLPTVGARGSALSPLRSRSQISRMKEEATGRAYSSIRLRGLARELLSIQAAGRRLPPFLRFALPRHQSLSPRLAAGTLSISAYNIIVDTVVFLTPLSGTFEPATVPKYLPFPGKRSSPRTVSMQGLFFIGFIHDEKRGRATLLFPVQFPAGSSSAHHDDLLGGRQQSHIFPSFMRNPVS